jgi:hypothetical protein
MHTMAVTTLAIKDNNAGIWGRFDFSIFGLRLIGLCGIILLVFVRGCDRSDDRGQNYHHCYDSDNFFIHITPCFNGNGYGLRSPYRFTVRATVLIVGCYHLTNQPINQSTLPIMPDDF